MRRDAGGVTHDKADGDPALKKLLAARVSIPEVSAGSYGPCGGNGRHDRLGIYCSRRACRFESGQGHVVMHFIME